MHIQDTGSVIGPLGAPLPNGDIFTISLTKDGFLYLNVYSKNNIHSVQISSLRHFIDQCLQTLGAK